MSIARQLLEADGYALWLLDETRVWRIIKSDGISPDFSARSIEGRDVSSPAASALLTEALPVEDVAAMSLLAAQRHLYEREGVRSMLVCPMRIGPSGAGTLVFYYRERHAFSRVEVQTAQALANLSAAALNTADLYEAQRRGREAAESVAMSRWQTLRMVILPQCIKRMTPPWMNLYAILTVATPLTSVVGVSEAMTLTGDILSSEARTELLVPMYLYLLLWFFLYCYPIARATLALEQRFAVK